jgi:competence protein ComEC
MRAAWMATVFLSAFLFQRRPDIMNALGVVMIAALLVDGNVLFLAGVQLSYGVVAAIALGLALTRKYIQRVSLFDDYLPRELYRNWQISASNRWHKLLQSLSISTTASLGSSPLTIYHFGMVTPISIIANLALTFFVAALLAIAIISSTLYIFSPTVASWSNRVNGMVAHGCINISSFFANIPGGHFTLSPRNEKHDVIRIFDLPRGGGACIIHTQDADHLLDTGDRNQFRTAVLPCIRAFGYEPDMILMSHAESAHIGGMVLAMEQLPIKQIILSVAESRASTFMQMQQVATNQDVPLYVARAPTTISLGPDVKWEISHTPDPQEKNAMSDERVVLYRLHFHGYRILFLNDASDRAIEQWLSTSTDPRCDVIVVGRHSYELPLSENHIALIKPQAIIASHSDFPKNEAIPPNWEKHLQEIGVTLFHQGRSGMVTIHHLPEGVLQIDGFLNEQKISLTTPVK